jgi:formate dehydrogenase subunit gamma
MMTKRAEPTAIVDAICKHYGDHPAALLEVLHDLQDALGYVPEAALPAIAKRLNIARAEVHGVLSFYHDFRTAPPPPVVVKLCRAEACQAMGGERLASEISAKLSEYGRVPVEPVYCLGLCALAPAALVNGQPVGRLSAERLIDAVQEASA